MLVYTNLFTLKGHIPRTNKYVTMFFIWFTYLKKYGGLDGTVGILIDTRTFEYIRSDFARISESCTFRIEFSTYPPPATLMEGCAQKYKCSFELNKINLYLDIDYLVIRPFYTIFKESHDTLYVNAEESMTDNKHGGFFLEGCVEARNLPGFSSGWFAFTQGEEVSKFLSDVPKSVLENADSPLSTLDQPFYNYEIFLRIIKKEGPRICSMDSKIISINPLFHSPELSDAYFVNLCDPIKMLSFMCVDFSFTQSQEPAWQKDEESEHRPLNQPAALAQQQQKKEELGRPGEASPAHREEGRSHRKPHAP